MLHTKSSQAVLYRGFEVCLNDFFHSCIPDGGTYLVSFAHNENEDEQCLKYDLHSKSVDSFIKFYNNFIKGLKNISAFSEGSFVYRQPAVREFPKNASFRNIADCFKSGETDFIIYDGLYIGFDLYSVEDDEIIFFFEMSSYLPKQEGAFTDAYVKATGKVFEIPHCVDEAIYANKDWCWGERFFISKDEVKYLNNQGI